MAHKGEVVFILPEQICRQAKAAAALEGKTLRDWLTAAVEEKVERTQLSLNA